MALKDVFDQHHDCEVVIIPRFHKGKSKLIPGLYCCQHAKLIKWLSPRQSHECQQLGVEVLPAVKEDKIKLLQQNVRFRSRPWLSKEELGI